MTPKLPALSGAGVAGEATVGHTLYRRGVGDNVRFGAAARLQRAADDGLWFHHSPK